MKLALLGATGSIGRQTLDVMKRHRDRIALSSATCGHDAAALEAAVRGFDPALLGVTQPGEAFAPRAGWVWGPNANERAILDTDCDTVLDAVVGMAGLGPVMTALESGRRVLLANKEALVAGGHLVMEAARRVGEHALLPVDSEHSAIFQCLQGAGANPYSRIILTCSGGPFRTWSKDDIRAAAKEQALKHPNWVMGQKITIDSATLFNKALEMIEAKWLFDARPDQIEVVVHPQSVIHSGVEFADGALIAQLGTPDMRLPILYAMAYPDRLPTGGSRLDLFSLGGLTFERPDEERFPSIRLARECLRAGGAAGCVLNAANEVAVGELLQSAGEEPMRVGRIFDTVEETLARVGHLPAASLEQVMEADRLARDTARQVLHKLG